MAEINHLEHVPAMCDHRGSLIPSFRHPEVLALLGEPRRATASALVARTIQLPPIHTRLIERTFDQISSPSVIEFASQRHNRGS
jgi:hypothetical protein